MILFHNDPANFFFNLTMKIIKPDEIAHIVKIITLIIFCKFLQVSSKASIVNQV